MRRERGEEHLEEPRQPRGGTGDVGKGVDRGGLGVGHRHAVPEDGDPHGGEQAQRRQAAGDDEAVGAQDADDGKAGPRSGSSD